jgi:hypothetical protein
MANDQATENQQAPLPVTKWWQNLGSIIPSVMTVSTLVLTGLLSTCILFVIIFGLITKNPIIRELSSIDYARGLITFVFAIGTIGIALLVAMGALIGNLSANTITTAKEVLTILIGIFGTILGFYFGTPPSTERDTLRNTLIVSPPTLQTAIDRQTMTMFAYISGGDLPYVYSIDFDKDVLPDVKEKKTVDGWIREIVNIANLDSVPVGYKITLTDSRKRTIEYQAKDYERIQRMM